MRRLRHYGGRRFGAGDMAEGYDAGVTDPSLVGQPYGPEYRPDLLTSAGDPTLADQPYGPEYRPAQLFLSEYKWWLIGGGVGLFLLAGGSILGLSLRKRRRSRR